MAELCDVMTNKAQTVYIPCTDQGGMHSQCSVCKKFFKARDPTQHSKATHETSEQHLAAIRAAKTKGRQSLILSHFAPRVPASALPAGPSVSAPAAVPGVATVRATSAAAVTAGGGAQLSEQLEDTMAGAQDETMMDLAEQMGAALEPAHASAQAAVSEADAATAAGLALTVPQGTPRGDQCGVAASEGAILLCSSSEEEDTWTQEASEAAAAGQAGVPAAALSVGGGPAAASRSAPAVRAAQTARISKRKRAAASPCQGYELNLPLEPDAVHQYLPYQMLAALGAKEDFFVKGTALYSTKCKEDGQLDGSCCSECTRLAGHKLVRGMEQRAHHGAPPHTSWKLLGFKHLMERLSSYAAEVNERKLASLNSSRASAVTTQAMGLYKRLVSALAANDVPRLLEVMAITIKQGGSPKCAVVSDVLCL